MYLYTIFMHRYVYTSIIYIGICTHIVFPFTAKVLNALQLPVLYVSFTDVPPAVLRQRKMLL